MALQAMPSGSCGLSSRRSFGSSSRDVLAADGEEREWGAEHIGEAHNHAWDDSQFTKRTGKEPDLQKVGELAEKRACTARQAGDGSLQASARAKRKYDEKSQTRARIEDKLSNKAHLQVRRDDLRRSVAGGRNNQCGVNACKIVRAIFW
jgi:hypothetical protein